MSEALTGKRCRPERRLVDLHIEADPPYCHYGRPEDPAWQRRTERWVKEFNAWVRDHRSQDDVTLRTVREEKVVCSACGVEWEVAKGRDLDAEEYEPDTLYCTYCGAEVEVTDE